MLHYRTPPAPKENHPPTPNPPVFKSKWWEPLEHTGRSRKQAGGLFRHAGDDQFLNLRSGHHVSTHLCFVYFYACRLYFTTIMAKSNSKVKVGKPQC